MRSKQQREYTGEPKQPRYDEEAELAVLGCVMLEPSTIATAVTKLRAGDFYSPSNALVFQAMVALAERSQPIDVVSLVAELRAMDRLDAAGGMNRLSQLADAVGTTVHVEHYCDLVAECAVARRVQSAGFRLQHMAADHAVTIEQLVREATDGITAALERRDTVKAVSLQQTVELLMDATINAADSGRVVVGLESSLSELSDVIGGYLPGKVYVMAGRPAMGKTSFAMQEAYHIARSSQRPVLAFSLEMMPDELTIRFVASATGIDSRRIRSGSLTPEESAAFFAAMPSVAQVPVHIVASGDNTVMGIRVLAREWARKGLAAIVVDYLQLLGSEPSGNRNENRENQISAISRGLKRIAMELRIPVIVVSQVSRKCEDRTDKRPILSDLRESGAVEQDADVVLFVYRDDYYNQNSPTQGFAEIIVAKARDSALGTIYARFQRTVTRFDNPTDDDREMLRSLQASEGPPRSSGGRRRGREMSS